MAVITDISIPADQFRLGQLLDEYPDIDIELVRVIPLRDGIIPLFWVAGGILTTSKPRFKTTRWPRRSTC